MSKEYFLNIRDKLNEVSPSFCLAKWQQVTLHLQNGRNHSCHHPNTHFIPVEEIDASPSALHNTKFKRTVQDEMIAGNRPPECQYCWNVEDMAGDQISDRYMKSADKNWADIDNIPEVLRKHELGEHINPHYVEVSFSNVCNFSCSYCSPVHSSQWTSEIRNHGAYKLHNRDHNGLEYYEQTNNMPIHHKDHNPYVDAFWKWWPELSKTLKVFRITGGEPLLDKNTFKVIDKISKEPNPELDLSINSNACVPNDKIDLYIEKISELIDNNKIKRHVLFTSVDGYGEQAEYGRHGLDYLTWVYNIDKILTKLPSVKVTIMCTANIFSVPSFETLLRDVYNLKVKHRHSGRVMPLTIDISFLRWPAHQSCAILPEQYADMLAPALEFMESHSAGYGNNTQVWEGFYAPMEMFWSGEVEKLKRLIEYVKQPPNPAEGINVESAMIDFYLFVNEHDARRGTNFLETFPELEEFYRDCEQLHNNAIPIANI